MLCGEWRFIYFSLLWNSCCCSHSPVMTAQNNYGSMRGRFTAAAVLLARIKVINVSLNKTPPCEPPERHSKCASQWSLNIEMRSILSCKRKIMRQPKRYFQIRNEYSLRVLTSRLRLNSVIGLARLCCWPAVCLLNVHVIVVVILQHFWLVKYWILRISIYKDRCAQCSDQLD